MSLGTSIVAAVAANAALVALIGDRVYPLEIPIDAPLPSLAWQKIATEPNSSLNEASADTDSFHHVQFTTVVDDYDKIEAIGVAIKAAFDNVAVFGLHKATCTDDRDMSSELPDRFAHSWDFTF